MPTPDLLPTDMCSCCHLPFKLLQPRGVVRRHDDHRGNRCPGSLLAPWEPLHKPWIEEAS